jgi:hypothetical protein
MDCDSATDYGQIITQERNGRTQLIKVRLYDDHQYNWHTTLISVYLGQPKQLHSITDQVYDLEATADYTRDLKGIVRFGSMVY